LSTNQLEEQTNEVSGKIIKGKQIIHSTEIEVERAVLVGIVVYPNTKEIVEEHLEELALLADTAGALVVDKFMQILPHPDGRYYIGKGKMEEIRDIIERDKITLFIADDELSPVQIRNLETQFKIKVLDRAGLILDIFSSRAKSSEAKTQVELAQLQYLMPRLTRMWTHLSKQFGGIGTKGPGETQIETDRRAIKIRIALLREKLDKIETQRETQRKGRGDKFRVALVGYTNAGKSTLMNELSGAGVYVENQLFATLDATVRSVDLEHGRVMLLSDTVGFIRKLPQHLIASFRSTLSEVKEADLLLHVVDSTQVSALDQIQVVNETLSQIDAQNIPIIMVLNKIDKLVKDDERLFDLRNLDSTSISISAQKGLGIQTLKDRIISAIEDTFVEQLIKLPLENYYVVSGLHDLADILKKKFDNEFAYLKIRYANKVNQRIQSALANAKAIKLEYKDIDFEKE
jgi:GTP-binding protein HflX